jgi:hypothetical protein
MYVVQERCFIGSRSNNQIEQENERRGLKREGLEREVLQREGVTVGSGSGYGRPISDRFGLI